MVLGLACCFGRLHSAVLIFCSTNEQLLHSCSSQPLLSRQYCLFQITDVFFCFACRLLAFLVFWFVCFPECRDVWCLLRVLRNVWTPPQGVLHIKFCFDTVCVLPVHLFLSIWTSILNNWQHFDVFQRIYISIIEGLGVRSEKGCKQIVPSVTLFQDCR